MGQLDRWPADIQEIARARDVTYGLFSVIFVGFITSAIPANADEDPLARMEQTAVEEVTTWITQHLAEVTQHGRKTAPAIPTLLGTLERSLGSQIRRKPQSRSRWAPYTVEDIKRKEINRLKALYADWEPIYKSPGEDGGSEFRTSTVESRIRPGSLAARLKAIIFRTPT